MIFYSCLGLAGYTFFGSNGAHLDATSKDPLVLQGRNREGLHFCGTPAPSHFFAFTYKHGDWPSSSAWLVEQVGGIFLSHFFFLSTLVGRKKFMAQPLLFLIDQSSTM